MGEVKTGRNPQEFSRRPRWRDREWPTPAMKKHAEEQIKRFNKMAGIAEEPPKSELYWVIREMEEAELVRKAIEEDDGPMWGRGG